MDPSAPHPGGGRGEDNNEGFDQEEVLQHLNFDCLDLGRDGEDGDSEVRGTAPSLWRSLRSLVAPILHR